MAVALHLSDLHRSSADPVSNAELIAALESDRRRWPVAVRNVDLIAISGDLIQGVPLGVADYRAQLDEQYSAASQFLDSLVQHFVGGDRSRLVLVPGNHDVDWNSARAAMQTVERDELDRLADQLPAIALNPHSIYRWSWAERQVLKITDRNLYDARRRSFLQFRRAFYANLDPSPLALDEDLVFVDYPGLDLSITGLSSWFGNDCFCQIGAFDADVVARAQDAIGSSASRLHVAVWHHSTSGGPAETNYLDVQRVHRLIDYGYRLGLHGHHHRADASVMPLKLPTLEEMALVSAGSLAAGRRELPTGVHRQYNVLEIDPVARRLRVHVREAIGELTFAESARTELGGRPYVELSWSAAPRGSGAATKFSSVLDGAYSAFGRGDLQRAYELLRTIPTRNGPERRLMTEVLANLGSSGELARLLAVPLSQDELMLLIDSLLRVRSPEIAQEKLHTYAPMLGVSTDLQKQIEARIAAAGLTA